MLKTHQPVHEEVLKKLFEGAQAKQEKEMDAFFAK